MTVFEALSVMFLFGMFILALLTYIHTCKKSRTAILGRERFSHRDWFI
ncbi:putative holin-like toxin [Paenibacillus alvei]|nr:putative holin-like toxin [Paenibacillus alvei]